jgi:hypothetical protein
MLFLHETHRVMGAHEEEFEQTYRDRWLPTLAETDDARLLWFLHHAHGTGRAYQVITITALRNGAAYESLAGRVQTGDLRSWAHDVDQLRHEVRGKILVAVPWSPLTELDLASVPTSGEHELTLYMEDTAWPHDGLLDDYLDAAQHHYAPSLTEGRHGGRALLELQAVFQTALASGRRSEVILWQKVMHPERIVNLVTTEIPAEYRAPGTWMHDALRVRDDWESRLLRTTRWSPLH